MNIVEFYQSELRTIYRDIQHAINDQDWHRLELKGQDLTVLARVLQKEAVKASIPAPRFKAYAERIKNGE